MNRMRVFLLLAMALLLGSGGVYADATPTLLLEKMDQVLRGDSHKMTVSLHVKTKRWERDYEIRVLMKGVDFAFARVLGPAKVRGQGFLRDKARLWNYLPTAERTILIPPSMMLDRFMGSDFSNDDFVKMSYMARDYSGVVVGEETLNEISVTHLTLTPHPDAPVTYEKLEVWLRTEDAAPVKMEFYDEDLEHIRTLHYSEFKDFSGHVTPTVWHMQNHKKPDRQTTLKIKDAEFNQALEDSFFSRENLERVP